MKKELRWFSGPNEQLASFDTYEAFHLMESGKLMADGDATLNWRSRKVSAVLYWRWVREMLPVRQELAFYAEKNRVYRLCKAAGRGDAIAENISVEMAGREVGWMPEEEWAVHRMRPPLSSAQLRGFADGLEPKPEVAAGRPSKYPWEKLESEAEGYRFILSPGPGTAKLTTLRVLASRKAKQTGWAISCKQLDDGSIEIVRRL